MIEQLGVATDILKHLRARPDARVTVQSDNEVAARADLEAVGATAAEQKRIRFAPIAKPKEPLPIMRAIPAGLLPDPHARPRVLTFDPRAIAAAEEKRARKAAKRLGR